MEKKEKRREKKLNDKKKKELKKEGKKPKKEHIYISKQVSWCFTPSQLVWEDI